MNQPEIKSEIKFGTDGWRAVISDKFTFKNVRVVAQAISDWINRHLKVSKGIKKLVVVGFDTRFLSDQYAEIVACVCAANGIDVLLSDGPIPTPTLSFAVTRSKALAGIMITASHNPGQFNGIKIKTAQGGAASRDITNIVESYLGYNEIKSLGKEDALRRKVVVVADLKKKYIEFLRNYLDLKKIKNSRSKVLADIMHGSGQTLMKEVLRGTKVRLSLMREDINPNFDGKKPEPVEEYVGGLLARINKEKFDLGLILDGDADRIAAATGEGKYVSPQKILGLLILHLVRNRKESGGVVKTICGTTMLDKIARKLKLKLYETPVGFKYISDLMVTEDILVGGEEAGGIGFHNYIPERDGTLAGLMLLEMMVSEKKSLKRLIGDMEKEFGQYYYERADLAIDRKRYDTEKIKKTRKLLGKKIIDIKDFDGIKMICEDESWLMFRPSGTEPLVRVYAEAKNLTKARKLVDLGKSILKKL